MDPVAQRLTQERHRGPGAARAEVLLIRPRQCARRRAASLSMVMRELVGGLPLEVKLLERHEFSSQTFVPLDVGRWLVVVCARAPLGGPDVAHGRALIAGPDRGITYRTNTWHHGFTVLDRPGRFAMFMWLDGSSGDEEFVPVTPFTIHLGG